MNRREAGKQYGFVYAKRVRCLETDHLSWEFRDQYSYGLV